MLVGPIEVLVVGFPGNQFTGEILPELERLVSADIIHIVDGLLVKKDADGSVTFLELDDIAGDENLARLSAMVDRLEALISDEDVEELVATLEPDSSAAILVFEHTWAIPLRDAIVGSGGVLAANFRVPGAVIDEVLAALADD